MKYTFGVMSKKWSLEAEDIVTAKIAMSISIGQNIPVVIYFPEKQGFMPTDVLEKNKDTFKPEDVKKCLDTIKEVL